MQNHYAAPGKPPWAYEPGTQFRAISGRYRHCLPVGAGKAPLINFYVSRSLAAYMQGGRAKKRRGNDRQNNHRYAGHDNKQASHG
jgi:hypothetical protein